LPQYPDRSRLYVERITESHRTAAIRAYDESLLSTSDAALDIEHSLADESTGITRFVHVRGQVVGDGAHPFGRISGTMQDITAQRALQWELEKQVAERTKELADLNAALQMANQALEEKNAALKYSNDELTQYAYVTSHDLQEPLRKIRFFVSMLSDQFGLPPETDRILQKVNKSSARMSQLIQDLLAFSRLLGTDEIMQPVDLGQIIAAVLEDFELMIQEKQASVRTAALPVVSGVGLQLNQLFHNLVGNALKFSAAGRTPEIAIRARRVSREEVLGVFPQAKQHFYQEISVSDNGIGFEPEFNDYIFDLFKQLHTRDAFPGSGIGLALCRRIANNHGGHIYAISELGKGSTFYLLLPASGEAVKDNDGDGGEFLWS
jgi:signal transduction histidine kinase